MNMMQTLTTTFSKLIILMFALVGLVVLSPAYVHAQDDSARAACESLEVIDGSDTCDDNNNDPTINSGLRTALNLLSLVAGVIAVIMITIAGLRYIMSQGESQKVSRAKTAIIYATVGIIIVALAQIIVRFIIDQTTP